MTTDEAGNGAEEEEEENTRDEYAENGNPMVEAPGNGRLAAAAAAAASDMDEEMGDETGAEAWLLSTEEKGAMAEAKHEDGAGGGESKPCEGNPRLMAGERNGVSPLKLGRLLIGLPVKSRFLSQISHRFIDQCFCLILRWWTIRFLALSLLFGQRPR